MSTTVAVIVGIIWGTVVGIYAGMRDWPFWKMLALSVAPWLILAVVL